VTAQIRLVSPQKCEQKGLQDQNTALQIRFGQRQLMFIFTKVVLQKAHFK
jgi:hypothetical protein